MRISISVGGHLAALLVILIWGTTFISTKVLLTDFSPVELLFFRFMIGYFALLLVYPHFVPIKSLSAELLFAGAGICGVTLYFLFENIALTYTLTSNVGILVSIAPFFTGLLAHFFLKGESLRKQFFIGFLVAMLGVSLILCNGSFVLKISPKGDILAILAAVSWAVYSILMRKIGALGLHNIGCTRRVFFYGLLFMLPVLALTGFHPNLSRFANPVALGNIIFLGLGASAACFVIWNWCMEVLGTVKTSNYIYLIPVVTILFANVILQERITGPALFGTLLTICGLILSERKGKTAQPVETISTSNT